MIAVPRGWDAPPGATHGGENPSPRVAVVFAGAGASAECFWQLTARNGRVLGRSPARFVDEADAVEDLAAVIGGGGQLSLVVCHSQHRAGWTWRVERVRSHPVIESHRVFERYDSCRRSGRSALQALSLLEAVRHDLQIDRRAIPAERG